ncbi:MAG: hypothetical protein HQM10_05040 [Candidatus Riflebacteria bacterium]|nr:hypothetical protein [Candidatus Riflebacteria bacterium]
MRKILFRTNGGLGKQIMATAIAAQIKKQYPDSVLHVVTSYPEAFAHLDCVDKYFPGNPQPYFYDEHKDFEILDAEPYTDLEYRQGKMHLVDVWCKKLGLNFPQEKRGYINLTSGEKGMAAKMLGNIPQDKPIIAFQFRGGTSYYDPNAANDPLRAKQTRDLDIETAQKVVNALIAKGCIILQIGLPTEPKLQNVLNLDPNNVINPRLLFALLDRCQGLLAIDSFAAHAWAALGRKDSAVILWGGTNPTNLSYAGHSALTSEKGKDCPMLHCNRPETFVGDFVGNNQPWACPRNGICMKFDPVMIVEAVIGSIADSVKDKK